MPLISWSESDLEKIRHVVRTVLRDLQNTPGRGLGSAVEHEEQQGPEFYVGKATDTITAMSGDTAGRGPARVYQVLGADEDNPVLEEVPGLDKDLLNVGGEVAADEWVLLSRDKYGRWWVINPGTGGAGETTFLAVLVDKEFQGDNPVYSWSRVIDAPPWGYVEVCPYVRGCPGHTPAYHEMNKDMPVVGAEPDDTGTGTPDVCEGADLGLCPGPLFIHPKSVVRMHRYGGEDTNTGTGTGTGTDEGGYCMFGAQPWIDLFRRTGVFDEYGEIGYRRKYVQSAQGGGGFVDGEEVRIVEAD